MTENELHELRELLVGHAERLEDDFWLPPRVWELVGLPEKAIAELRKNAAGYRREAFRTSNYDQAISAQAQFWNAEADVLEAEAAVLEAKTRFTELGQRLSKGTEGPGGEAV